MATFYLASIWLFVLITKANLQLEKGKNLVKTSHSAFTQIVNLTENQWYYQHHWTNIEQIVNELWNKTRKSSKTLFLIKTAENAPIKIKTLANYLVKKLMRTCAVQQRSDICDFYYKGPFMEPGKIFNDFRIIEKIDFYIVVAEDHDELLECVQTCQSYNNYRRNAFFLFILHEKVEAELEYFVRILVKIHLVNFLIIVPPKTIGLNFSGYNLKAIHPCTKNQQPFELSRYHMNPFIISNGFVILTK